MTRRNERSATFIRCGAKELLVRPAPKMTFHSALKILAWLGLASFSTLSAAEAWGPFTVVESKPISEIWINPGFYTYHFQRDMGFNGENSGLGGEYRYSTRSSIAAGSFHNSDWLRSRYIAWSWQPLALGPVRLGAAVGGMDGYPRMLKGAWFPFAIPVVSLEYKSIGANIILIPNYKDKIYGALSLQIKVKVY